MNTKLQRLHGAAHKFAADAEAIAAKADAEGREDLTPDEKAEFDNLVAKARDALEAFKAAKADADVLAAAKALGDSIGLPGGDVDVQGGAGDLRTRAKAASLGLQVVGSAEFKALMGQFKGGRIPNGTRVQSSPIPVKGLFTGDSDASAGAFVTPDQSGIVELLGRLPLRLRSLCSVRTTGSDTVEYVRQTSHTNAAAAVAEATSSDAPTVTTEDDGAGGYTSTVVKAAGGGYKPEGSWAFERVTATVKTLAEWVPATKRALADAGQLRGLIDDELAKDLADHEEDQILNGDGTGENFPGILSTSGIQSQVWATDLWTTTRKAVTKARTVGKVAPNGWLLNPADVETIDLAREGSGSGAFLGAGPFSMGPRTLWGIPIVESSTIAAGTGLLGDFSKAVLWDRQETTITLSDSHEDFFVRNLVAVLAEQREAFGVTRPSAFVSVAMTS